MARLLHIYDDIFTTLLRHYCILMRMLFVITAIMGHYYLLLQ